MFKVTVDTENPSIVGHIVNINTFLSAESVIDHTAEDALKRIPKYKKELAEMHGYSDQIISQLQFSVVSINTAPEYDFGYTTIEGVVERINDGPVQGFEHLTSEYLAAAYAVAAADEGEGPVTADDIEAHLEILSEHGASFDHNQALDLGRGK